nr:MAG: hypothetical protein [Bacteriophage sp.]UVX57387.1 MAG: hypothetical protein [Bacteriophage sp.]UVX63577.1 MAG: hypothetical protein [Bacteriophage sp.]
MVMIPKVTIIIRVKGLIDHNISLGIISIGPVYHLPAFLVLDLYIEDRMMNGEIKTRVINPVLYQDLHQITYLIKTTIRLLKPLAKDTMDVLSRSSQLILHGLDIIQ